MHFDSRMPKAEIKVDGRDPLPCPNCGKCPHDSVKVVSGAGVVALSACEKCWPEALRRGQLEAVKGLCRAADRRAAGQVAPDLSALR